MNKENKGAREQNISKCVEFSGKITPNGYGWLSVYGRTTGAHRIAWALQNGRMPKKGMDICHTCDNRKCINPLHLFEGTRRENMADCKVKNRLNPHNRNKTHCIRGHKFAEDKSDIKPSGKRPCKACKKIDNRNWRIKNGQKKGVLDS